MSQVAATHVQPPEGPGQSAPPLQSASYRYYALGVLTFTYVLNFVDRQILTVVQEPMKAELGLSDFELGLLQGTFFAIFYVVVGIPIARWADIANRRTIVAISVTLWSAMTALQGAATNFIALAVARFGVGIGEAGGSPPAHSMISDMFPPSERARALAIYSSGVTFGVMLAYVAGGWISDTFGWRLVFVAIGLPGVAVGALVMLTLREPARGAYDKPGAAHAEAPPMLSVIRVLLSRRSFVLLSVAAGLHAFTAYGIGAFIVSFFKRTYAIEATSDVTLPLGIMIGVAGGIGNYAGGYLADLWGKRDVRYYMWVPAVSTLLAIPFAYASFLTNDFTLSLALYFLPLVFGYMYLGPTLAMTHALVSPRMRALASSILFFILNAIGLGLGPTVTGLVSDILKGGISLPGALSRGLDGLAGDGASTALANGLGDDSLRYAILLMFVAYLAAALIYFRAARYLPQDLEAAPS